MTATAAITFACERVRDLWDELLPLMVAHHEERREATPSLPPLEVDLVQYEVLDATTNLRVYTARADGELVGYACYVLANHLHSRSERVAHHDGVFLAREHRAALAGVELVLHAERALRAEGVAIVYQAAAAGSPTGRMFERLGYVATETTYAKRLGR